MLQNIFWVSLLILGALLLLGKRCLPWFGHLPGDFTFQHGSLTVFLPLGTSLLVSIILSLLVSLFAKK